MDKNIQWFKIVWKKQLTDKINAFLKMDSNRMKGAENISARPFFLPEI